MGKRKWQRVRLVDLADSETQQKILSLIDQVSLPKSNEEGRGSESPKTPND
jgi:hypothetical protein